MNRLTTFLLYNTVFFGLQLLYILTQSGSFIETLALPSGVRWELISTLGVHLTLYVLLTALQGFLLWGLETSKSVKTSQDANILIIWSLSVCALITLNGYFFPASAFSRLFFPAIPDGIMLTVMIGALILLTMLLINSLVRAPHVGVSMLIACASLIIYYQKPITNTPFLAKQPNIILIGIDSLSPLQINASLAPHLSHFIDHSVYFKETISPLARTYPAWFTILTGLYPEHHKARYNLMPPEKINHSASIAWLLQQHGYTTWYATDDRRFNSINEDEGFQRVIGPKLGVNDMLLGTFNDFPLSNLFVNLPISRWLFPYNYMNRASHYTYYPSTFDKALARALIQRDKKNPLFLAVHFTLPHWPYAWAPSRPVRLPDEYSAQEQQQLHQETLIAVDNQVEKLLATLAQQDELRDSLVILLSDHGEAFYKKGSRQTLNATYQGKQPSLLGDYVKRYTSTSLEESAGHGSDLLSTDQYHCVLAFMRYKANQPITTPKVIGERVALIDIAPTILDFLQLTLTRQLDGLSLLATLTQTSQLPERAFVLESGMLPNQFLTREAARKMGKRYFTIDAQTGRLQLRNDMLMQLDSMKLYAVIDKQWELALYPENKTYLPILLNLTHQTWVDDLSSPFAKKSPALKLLSYLENFYRHPWAISQEPVSGEQHGKEEKEST